MPRPLRGTIAAGIYHVNRRSAGPIEMYHDDFDRTDFCNRLAKTVTKFGWKCHAFVLMTTHYHLLVEVDENALQPGMHMLNSQYAQCFNRRWTRNGHLKGSPYGAKLVEGETQFLRVVRYIARNPVEAGLCEHPADWTWGSYRGAAGYDRGFAFVTNELVWSSLHDNRSKAQQLLRVLVEAL